jgi:anti-anti-sigma factor
MKPNIEILEPTGILDGTQEDSLREQVENAIKRNADVFLIDLKNVTFVDSSGLGTLVVVLKKARAAGKDMYVCSVNEQVRMLFELTSMDQIFTVFPDASAFEANMATPSKA